MNSFCVSAPVKSTSTVFHESRVIAVSSIGKLAHVAICRTLDTSELQLIGGGDVAVGIR
jgi:hypothetical protein